MYIRPSHSQQYEFVAVLLILEHFVLILWIRTFQLMGFKCGPDEETQPVGSEQTKELYFCGQEISMRFIKHSWLHGQWSIFTLPRTMFMFSRLMKMFTFINVL